jgi:endoglucanase Acf2
MLFSYPPQATNAYYGAYLYASALGNLDLQRFSQLLMTMEIQAAQTYWHMSTDDIYDNIFAAGRMVGNVGAFDVTSSTWFGNQVEFVHGINM